MAVVYIRTVNEQGEMITTLVVSKTKVAPLKRLTIPCLKLTGAFLLTKLIFHLLNALDKLNTSIFMWTDFSITNTWITHHHDGKTLCITESAIFKILCLKQCGDSFLVMKIQLI